jgi:DNA repair protein RadC
MSYPNTKLSIKQWAEEDRPREKLLLKGRSVLTDAELIAILIGSGTATMSAVDLAKHLLAETGNNLNALAQLSVKDLMKFKGIGEAKAISIVSALELGRRRKSEEPARKNIIRSSKDIYEIMKPELLDLTVEEFWVLLLRRNNEVIRKVRVSSGGLAGTVVDVRVVFRHAMEDLASYIVMVHNHPSGNLAPSRQDEQLTNKFKQAGLLLDQPIIDHVIFTNDGYYSFADDGKL